VTLWRTGSANIQRGDTQQGLQCCVDALALARDPYDSAQARSVHGYGLIKDGQVDAGVAELSDVTEWFASSRLPYSRSIVMLWLAEGYLAQGNRDSARPLVEEALNLSRATGYLHYEALGHRLMGACIGAEAPPAAEEHLEGALRLFERLGMRNDVAKALVTKAELRRAAGDIATARQLLHEAQAIFERLGTRDEPARVKAALADLDPSSRDLPARKVRAPRPVTAEPGRHVER
jgi:tetratricopeptide (TPR) repeat protein